MTRRPALPERLIRVMHEVTCDYCNDRAELLVFHNEPLEESVDAFASDGWLFDNHLSFCSERCELSWWKRFTPR